MKDGAVCTELQPFIQKIKMVQRLTQRHGREFGFLVCEGTPEVMLKGGNRRSINLGNCGSKANILSVHSHPSGKAYPSIIDVIVGANNNVRLSCIIGDSQVQCNEYHLDGNVITREPRCQFKLEK